MDITEMVKKRLLSEIALPERTREFVLDVIKPALDAAQAELNRRPADA